MLAVSSTKLRTLRALIEERHFALVDRALLNQTAK